MLLIPVFILKDDVTLGCKDSLSTRKIYNINIKYNKVYFYLYLTREKLLIQNHNESLDLKRRG